jgi:hypothetical protein
LCAPVFYERIVVPNLPRDRGDVMAAGFMGSNVQAWWLRKAVSCTNRINNSFSKSLNDRRTLRFQPLHAVFLMFPLALVYNVL